MNEKIELAEWSTGTRSALEIGIGTFIGKSLTQESLQKLQILCKPALLITLTLVIRGLAIRLFSNLLL